MTTVVTYIEVQPDKTTRAIALIKGYSTDSGKEAGLSARDVFQETPRGNRFVVVETWQDDAALHIHESTEPTLKFASALREILGAPNDQRMHTSFAVGVGPQAAPPGALFVVTHVDVPPPRREETEAVLKRVSEQSRSHSGNLRYDVFQQLAPRTNHFSVVECWADEKAVAAHATHPDSLAYREALGPMLGAPYEDRLYRSLGR